MIAIVTSIVRYRYFPRSSRRRYIITVYVYRQHYLSCEFLLCLHTTITIIVHITFFPLTCPTHIYISTWTYIRTIIRYRYIIIIIVITYRVVSFYLTSSHQSLVILFIIIIYSTYIYVCLSTHLVAIVYADWLFEYVRIHDRW